MEKNATSHAHVERIQNLVVSSFTGFGTLTPSSFDLDCDVAAPENEGAQATSLVAHDEQSRLVQSEFCLKRCSNTLFSTHGRKQNKKTWGLDA